MPKETMNPARLDAIPLFAELPHADRAAIAAVAGEAGARPGDVLAADGAFAFELMAIEAGEAELFRDGELVSRLCPGDVVGEIGAFERHVRTTTIVAATGMRLLTVTAVDLRSLRRNHPAAVARLQGLLLRRRTPASHC